MKVGRNDLCPCGSGKKYKKCCLGKSGTVVEKQPTSMDLSEFSIHDRNLILLGAIGDIFGLNRGVEWGEVKRTISGDQIRELYSVIADLWPPNTDIESLLPPPTEKLRALYLGDIHPELIVQNVCRFGLYTDEILIIDPFHNPHCMAEKYNPLANPNQFKRDTLKLLFAATLLAPWIINGLVTLIPDPGDFDYGLRKETWELAEKRIGEEWTPDEKLMEEFKPNFKKEFARFMTTLPKSFLAQKAKQAIPGISDEQVELFLQDMDRIRRDDPLALDQFIEETGGQLQLVRSGGNLEMASYIAHLTGAFPYTNISFRWKEILSTVGDLPETAKVWSPLTKAFQSLRFNFLNKVDPQFACSLRTDGRLESFRGFLRRIWNTVGGEPDPSKVESLARDFSDELTQEYHKADAEWREIGRSLINQLGTTITGGIIAGKFLPEISTIGFALAGVLELLNAKIKRRQFRKKIPMSVFIDLSNT